MSKWTVVIPSCGTHEIEADRMSSDNDSIIFKTGPEGTGKTVATIFKAPGVLVSRSELVTVKQ